MAKRKNKKIGYVKCGICGKKIPYTRGYVKVDGVQPGKLQAIRRHWAKKHPKAWRQAIKRGVIKRTKKTKTRKLRR